MADIATVFMGAQFGLESVPGTGVAASKKMLSFGVQPSIQAELKRFRPMGTKFDTIAVLEKEWVNAGIQGTADYNELAYLLTGILMADTPSGASDAKTWGPLTMDHDGPDTVPTFTVEYGSSERAHKFAYGLMTAFGLDISRAGVNVTGQMIGRALQDDQAMTASPTSAAQAPISSTHVSGYFADAGAGLAGASALTRLISANLAINNRRNAAWFLNRTNAANWVDVEAVPDVTLRMKVEADDAGMALLTKMRTNSLQFARIEAVGPVIEDTTTYKLTIDVAGRVISVGTFEDADGIYAIEWTLGANFDATFGKALEVTLINKLAAL